MLDTGAPFYEVYETSDGQYFAGGRHRGQVLRRSCSKVLGWRTTTSLPAQMDRDHWPAMKRRFAAVFRTKTRDEWAAIFDGTDACVEPVLSPWEAHVHPHNVARSTFIEVDGVVQPAPAPQFCRTPSAVSAGRRHLPGPTPWRASSSGASTRRRSPSCGSRGR